MTEFRVEGPVPDFFIVGAPKCGTTALNDHLSQHPDIFMIPKEVHQFGGIENVPFPRIGWDEYEGLCNSAEPSQTIGEASVWYLYDGNAAERIHSANPDARIVAILRNPPDMLHSLHGQHVFSGVEPIEDFRAALEAESWRADAAEGALGGRFLPSAWFYSKIAMYTEQLQRYVDLFGRDRVFVILHEDYSNSPETVYRELAGFLDVDRSFSPSFRKKNEQKRARSKTAGKFLNTILNSSTMRKTLRPIFSYRFRHRVLFFLYWLNMAKEERPRLDRDTKLKLLRIYDDEIDRLSEFLGRDLSHWKDV